MFKSNLNYKEVYRSLVDELKSYVRSNNLHGAVLGVSGGIDSTLVAALACKAEEELQKERWGFKFLGIEMPTGTTDASEKEVADEVLNYFTHYSSTINIDNIFYKFHETIYESCVGNDVFGENNHEDKKKLRNGNIKSRIRMILLYDAAKAINGIVLGTDNYSEYLLGFSTIGGDALFDYCPIQYLWKTEVFGLARYIADEYRSRPGFMNEKRAKAIEDSLSLKPMDGLGISDDDMAQIGAKDYYQVDDILQNYLSGNIEGISEDVGDRAFMNVTGRYLSTEYKRHHPVRVPREAYEKEKGE